MERFIFCIVLILQFYYSFSEDLLFWETIFRLNESDSSKTGREGTFEVPLSAAYKIIAGGAKGAKWKGGQIVATEMMLLKNTVIKFVVGKSGGKIPGTDITVGGGGATFVYFKNKTLILVGGGGGGTGGRCNQNLKKSLEVNSVSLRGDEGFIEKCQKGQPFCGGPGAGWKGPNDTFVNTKSGKPGSGPENNFEGGEGGEDPVTGERHSFGGFGGGGGGSAGSPSVAYAGGGGGGYYGGTGGQAGSCGGNGDSFCNIHLKCSYKASKRNRGGFFIIMIHKNAVNICPD